MMLFPVPQMARDGINRKPAGYLIVAGQRVGAVPNSRTDLLVQSSDDGLDYLNRQLRGQLPQLASKGSIFSTLSGANVVARQGRVIFGIKYFDVSDNDSRPLILTTDNGWDFTLRPHPQDGTGNDRTIAGLVVFGNDIVGVLESGETVISADNGATWENGPATGLAGVASVAANGTAIVAVGKGGVIKSTTAPRVAWTDRASQFAGSDIISVAASPTAFVAVGSGGKASSGTVDGSVWTARNTGVATNVQLGFVFYTGSRWFISATGTWLTSTNLTSWAVPASNYWSGSQYPIRRVFEGPDKTVLIYGNGQMAYSMDHLTWAQVENDDFEGKTVFAAVYRG